MKVWIDQDLCTGDGLCEEISPAVFTLLDDGLAYVKDANKVYNDPAGAEGLAEIPDGELEGVIESAEECPASASSSKSSDRSAHEPDPSGSTAPRCGRLI